MGSSRDIGEHITARTGPNQKIHRGHCRSYKEQRFAFNLTISKSLSSQSYRVSKLGIGISQ
jgi:hypothetical protein